MELAPPKQGGRCILDIKRDAPRYVSLQERAITPDGRVAFLKFKVRYFAKEKVDPEHVVKGHPKATSRGGVELWLLD